MMRIKSPALLLSYDHGGYIFWGERFKECLEQSFSWLEKYPDFKIGLDNEAFAYDAYAAEAPEIIELISEGLKRYAGRFGIGSCTYGQPLAAFINDESNVRQLTYAIKTNTKHFGITPPVYAVSEHAFHAQMPQLIAGVGYRGAIMRTHFMMYGYNPTFKAAFGKWVGPDGTAINTVPTYEGQGASFAVTTFDNRVLTRWPDQTPVSLEDFCAAFEGIEPLLASRYDDGMLRCEELVRHTQGNRQYRWVLLEDLPALYAEPKEIFMPKPGDFKSRMPWGYCGNRIWNDCRTAERCVALAERANALTVLLGGEDQSDALEAAWKKLLISQHHDIQICGLTDEAGRHLAQSIDLSKNALSASMRALSGAAGRGEAPGVTVLNPLSWDARQPVSCDIELPKGSAYKGFSLLCGNEEIPCAFDVYDYDRNGIRRARVYFTADVPSLAAKRYEIRDTAPGDSAFTYSHGILRGPSYMARLNENGIVSITDACTGKAFACSDQGTLFSGVIDGALETSRGTWKIYRKSGLAEALYLGTISAVGIRFSMTFYADSPRIDCSVTFRHNGERIGKIYDNAVDTRNPFYSLPTPNDNLNGFVHEDKLCFHLELPFGGTMTKAHDLPFMVAETGDDIVQGNYWVAVYNGEGGVAFLNRGAMCAVYRDGAFKVPLAYANDYVWGSRLLYGDYTHAFSLFPFTGTPAEAGVHREAIAYQYPFTAFFDKGDQAGTGQTPRVVQPIKIISDPNAVMSALYAEDGKIRMRMYEMNGKPASVQVNHALHEVNLLGEETGAAPRQDAMLGAYSIRTFNIERESPPLR